ncbi:hypothetical protein B0H19DRAFT_1245378 [Mycena capillaripes]|nr:hypothetical protein B0H19DRAFT_1245378 [Mycena capillaripes]
MRHSTTAPYQITTPRQPHIKRLHTTRLQACPRKQGSIPHESHLKYRYPLVLSLVTPTSTIAISIPAAPIAYQTLGLLLTHLNCLLCTPPAGHEFEFRGTCALVADPAVAPAACVVTVAWELIEKTLLAFNPPIHASSDSYDYNWNSKSSVNAYYHDFRCNWNAGYISALIKYPELAAAIAKETGDCILKKEVTFTPIATTGVVEVDELAKMGLYLDTPVPNPDLMELGVQFGSLEEFIRPEVVPRYV